MRSVPGVKLLVEWSDSSLVLSPEKSYVLGRDESCDLVITDSKISRVHLRFIYASNVWVIEDIQSSNGTFVANKQVSSISVQKNLKVFVGGKDHIQISITPLDGHSTTEVSISQETAFIRLDSPEFSEQSDEFGRVRLQKRIRIGRDPDNDWVIPDLSVSRNHAEIVQTNSDIFELIDLKSTNGTFVNGRKIRRHTLIVGDVISIGKIVRRFTSDGIESIEGTIGTSIVGSEVSFSVQNKILLDSVSFNLGPRTLTAVIGPSGAGKSTLLGVLTGRTKPSSGTVQVGGQDLHENFQTLGKTIGSVPQSDILHTRLTVKQALNYGAKLRLPADVDAVEREARVEEVMEKLELSERANLRIDKLSGGQRKRASIGLELLTSPNVLVLDEPTSGLDPGLDAHVMETLRTLADEGQTVVVVTHSVDNLHICDNVILMASGGHIAYCGPANSVFSVLKKKTWAEVFRFLASQDAIEMAQKRHSSPASSVLAKDHLVENGQNFFARMMTLSSRYIRVIISDRFYLMLLALIPLVVGLISSAAGSKYGFGPGIEKAPNVYYNPYAQATILVLVLGSVFIGLSTGIQEIVKENAIRMREQALGVSPLSYISSKILILGLIVIFQILIFTSIVLFGRPMAPSGLFLGSSRLELIIIAMILGVSSMMLGLFVSSFLSSNEQAMPSLVGITMFEVVVSGALPLMANDFIEQVSKIAPSYWATNSFAASVNLIGISRIRDEIEVNKWAYSQSTIQSSLLIILLFSVLMVALATLRIRHKR